MKYYSIKILIRILVLTIVTGLTILAFLDDRIFINRFILLVILAVVIAELFWFLNYTNRQLALFIDSLKNEDYTMRFPGKGQNGFINKLNRNFQEVIQLARDRRSAEKGQDQFMEAAFDRLNAGFITVSVEGEIQHMNQKAGELLGTGRLHSLDALRRVHPDFESTVMSSSAEGRLIDLRIRQRPVTLSLRTSVLKLDDRNYRLVVFHNIREALDAREIESWTRLIRILTHEIMNSVTPIASLSESMHQQLVKDGHIKKTSDIRHEELEDLSYSLQTINRRSEGLLSFVDDYRKLMRVGKPDIRAIPAGPFIGDLINLYQEEIAAHGVTTESKIHADAVILADRTLLEQAVINILRNALDALAQTPDPKITISYREDAEFGCLSISDNGEGITEEELREVFVPFFTTKQQGSGIGLSLARQILHAHKGTIHLESVVNGGTTCSLFIPLNQ